MKKKTKDGWSSEHVDKIHKIIKESLNHFEITQLTTILLEDGHLSQAGINAINAIKVLN
jgi:hypothetical protein